jgi:hypothetical protein
VLAVGAATGAGPSAAAPGGAPDDGFGVTPQAPCVEGSLPEAVQGRVPLADYDNGRAAQGYTCNATQIGHDGNSGGFRVHRYVDAAGHECAYYDTTLLIGASVLLDGDVGVAVLDMADPANPVRTSTLVTPAMLSPHESLSLNEERGLLAAIMGTPATAPGQVDIYDISADCRFPVLRSSTPLGILGHEATFSPDGRTLYTSATSAAYLGALDVTNPSLPTIAWSTTDYFVHGMNVSDDGSRLYAAAISGAGGERGVTILDVSQVRDRVAQPVVPVVGQVTWPNVSIPQTAIPITVGGHPYLVEIDEYAGTAGTAPSDPVGAGRIIDLADETAPVVVADLRLEVNEPAARATDQADDPGAGNPAQGYAGHYCSVPRRDDPGIVACSFIASGLRVFDISDPTAPIEIAYFNPPTREVADLALDPAAVTAADAGTALPERAVDFAPGLFACQLSATNAPGDVGAAAAGGDPLNGLTDILTLSIARGTTLSHWAMSAPAFVPERGEVWYSDGLYGFYAVRLDPSVYAVAPAPSPSPVTATTTPGAGPTTVAATPVGGTGAARLPATGVDGGAPGRAALALLVALGIGAVARRSRLRPG